jgi:hypothetical protein
LQPYRWHGGSPETTPRQDLPYIHEQDALELVDLAVELLCREYGYRLPERPKPEPGHGGGPADWQHLIANIREGRELHDSLRDLSGKLRTAGMSASAAVNLLRAHMQESTAPRDDRWTAGYDDIPRLIGNVANAPPTTVFDPWAEYQVPAFPLDILPPVARDFVAAISAADDCHCSKDAFI